MRTALKSVIVVILLAIVARPLVAQSKPTDAERAARQTQLQDFINARNALLTEWDGVVKQEAAREQAAECNASQNTQTTFDYNNCLGAELKVTRSNYAHLAGLIRKFLNISSAAGPNDVIDGATGTSHTGAEMVQAFDNIEKAWQPYESALCEAAFMEHQPGTIAPSQSLRCEIRVVRSHIKDLDATFQPLTR